MSDVQPPVPASSPGVVYVALALAGTAAIAVPLLFQGQVGRARRVQQELEQLMPLCRTLTPLLDACEEFPDARAAVMRQLEQPSPFPGAWLSVFAPSGDVWADSRQPVGPRGPVAPTAGQREAFRVAREALQAEPDAPAVLARRVAHSDMTGQTGNLALSAATTSQGVVLVVQME